jgi:hypothetical protein
MRGTRERVVVRDPRSVTREEKDNRAAAYRTLLFALMLVQVEFKPRV